MKDKEVFDIVRKGYAKANKEYLKEQIRKASMYCESFEKSSEIKRLSNDLTGKVKK